MKRLGAMVLISVTLAIPACAGDFNAVKKGIESNYGIRPLHPHLIGLGLFFVKPAMWGSGVSGVKVAIFENQNGSFRPSPDVVERIMLSSLGPGWQPFVRVHSRRGDGEDTIIYADCHGGKQMHLVLAAVERKELVLVQLKVKEKGIRRWMADPEHEARNATHSR